MARLLKPHEKAAKQAGKVGEKYNNTTCQCQKGHVHDSRGEAGYCDQLRIREMAKDIKEYKTQKKYVLKVNGVPITTHKPDFLITHNDGSLQVIEYKGFSTDLWKMKAKLFKAIFPELNYTVVWHDPKVNSKKKWKDVYKKQRDSKK